MPLPQAPTVLIVLMGSLGDVVRALPLASILRQHRPDARVAWMVDWRWREVVAAHSGVDRILAFPRERTPRPFMRLVADLRALRPDVVLDLQRILKSGVASRLTGAPRRIGFHRRDAKEFNPLFNNECIGPGAADLPKWRHYLGFVEQLGLPVPGDLDFGIRSLGDARNLPDELRGDEEEPLVAFAMGASWPSKRWSEDGYRALAGIVLRETPCRVVLVGDRSQQGLAARVARSAPRERVIDLAGRTSLTQLGAILAAACAAVGPDSGPGHLAAALGTPHVTLVGPTDPARVAPYRAGHLVVLSPIPCDPRCGRACHRREGRCMDAITPAVVWQALAPLLARAGCSRDSQRGSTTS